LAGPTQHVTHHNPAHAMLRRSEKSHELTPEERSRGGRLRAAKIYTAKAEAAAQGKPYKPLRHRRRSSFGFSGDPYSRARPEPAVPEPEYEPETFAELTDDEVAAEARAFWLDEWCDRVDREHDEGLPPSFVEQ
jgi:hypothetical protein